MEAIEIINILQVDLATFKAKGLTSVNIDSLDKYLEDLSANTGQSIEFQKLQYSGTLAHYDAQTKYNLEFFKSVIDSGREALNALVLINGGAVVALLSFMGVTLSKGLFFELGSNLKCSILSFGFGVLMGALGFGGRYLSQFLYALGKNKSGNTALVFTVVFSIIGYTLFGYGIFGAYIAFDKHFTL